MYEKKIILASSSPRRITILKELGIPFQAISPVIDEEISLGQTEGGKLEVSKVAVRLSRLKAKSVAQDYNNQLVLGLDTLVSIQNRILGKPSNLQEAYNFLSLLSGKIHQVITGFTLIHIQKEYLFSDFGLTNVYVNSISKAEIKEYIDQENVMDAAGAYKIQSFFSKHISKIEGSFHNVIGLPVSQVYTAIQTYENYLSGQS